MLTLTAYPTGIGPYERWELTVDATGEVLMQGVSFPLDEYAIWKVCDAYHAKQLQAASDPPLRSGLSWRPWLRFRALPLP